MFFSSGKVQIELMRIPEHVEVWHWHARLGLRPETVLIQVCRQPTIAVAEAAAIVTALSPCARKRVCRYESSRMTVARTQSTVHTRHDSGHSDQDSSERVRKSDHDGAA
jgi:hypothetical protein